MKTNRLLLKLKALAVLIILTFILLIGPLRAQECCHKSQVIYYYDYSNGTIHCVMNDQSAITRPIPFKANKDIQFHIYNFNPLREEISVENTFSEWFLGDSAKFSACLSIPNAKGFQNVDQNDRSTKGVSDKEESNDKPDTTVKVDPCKEVNNYKAKFNELLSDSKSKISIYKEYLSTVELINIDYNYLKSLPYISTEIVKKRLRNNFLSRYNDLVSSLGYQNQNLFSVSSQINIIEEELFKNITSKETEVLDFQKRMSANLKSDNCKEGYDDLVVQLNILSQGFSELSKERTEKVIPGLSKITATYDHLLFYASNDPSLITPALTIDKDLHTVSIFSKRLENKEIVLVDKINIEPTCGFKIDFSMGLFVSGLYDQQFTLKSKDSIYSQEYISGDTINDSLKSGIFKAIFRKDNLPISFGAMLFMHAHSQNQGILNYGFSLGFGSLFNDQARLTYSAGISGILGKKQRLVLTIGAALSQVDKLGVPYKVGIWYNENIDNVPIDRVWDWDWMFGVTWNLK